MKKKIKSHDDGDGFHPILTIAVILFGILSAYTTALGILNIWEFKNTFERIFFSWGFAIATSLMMVYLILKMPNFISKNKGWIVFFSYVIIASISLFFNFNAFFSELSKNSILASEIRTIQRKSSELSETAKKKLRDYLKIDFFQSKLDELSADEESEKNHNLRPGEGPIHQKIKEEKNRVKNILKSRNERLSLIYKEISSIVLPIAEEAQTAIESNDENIMRKSLEQIKMKYSNLLAYTSQYLTSIQQSNFQLTSFETERINSPDQSLSMVFLLISNYSSLKDWQKNSIIIAFILAFVLDFPIFLSLFIINIGSFYAENEIVINENDYPTNKKKDNKSSQFNPFIEF